MKKFLIFAALLFISHTCLAENVGLSQAMDMANGANTSGKCYSDAAPQSESGRRVYCTDVDGNPLPARASTSLTGMATQYFQANENTHGVSAERAKLYKKMDEHQKSRESSTTFVAGLMPSAQGDDWFDNKGQVTRVSRNWVDKKREPAKDNGTFRIAIEKVILNGSPAVRVFETHGQPVCGTGLCQVSIDQYVEHIIAAPSYFTTLRGAMQPGKDNDAYIIDEEVVEILWDAPYYKLIPLSAAKENVHAIFDTTGFRIKHPAPRVVEIK